MGTTKRKSKYTAERQLQSNAANVGNVSVEHYQSGRTVIIIEEALTDEAKHDVLHAIDEVLVHHKQ